MSIPELGKYMENGINIDPVPLTMEEFAVAGGMGDKVSLFLSVFFFYFLIFSCFFFKISCLFLSKYLGRSASLHMIFLYCVTSLCRHSKICTSEYVNRL